MAGTPMAIGWPLRRTAGATRSTWPPATRSSAPPGGNSRRNRCPCWPGSPRRSRSAPPNSDPGPGPRAPARLTRGHPDLGADLLQDALPTRRTAGVTGPAAVAKQIEVELQLLPGRGEGQEGVMLFLEGRS